MKKTLSTVAAIALSCVALIGTVIAEQKNQTPSKIQAAEHSNIDVKTAIFAGGCFWCIESDFEKLEGVFSAESGYTGGAADTADYNTVSYTETGHFEAVEVSYAPSKVSYSQLVEYFWRHIDPTDPRGQFCDKGSSYRSAIFYGNDEEQAIVEASLANLEANKPFDGDIVTTITSAQPFYSAEDYHQDYYKKNPIRYRLYRNGCGRDKRVAELWGK